jgi:hypothetical protein
MSDSAYTARQSVRFRAWIAQAALSDQALAHVHLAQVDLMAVAEGLLWPMDDVSQEAQEKAQRFTAGWDLYRHGAAYARVYAATVAQGGDPSRLTISLDTDSQGLLGFELAQCTDAEAAWKEYTQDLDANILAEALARALFHHHTASPDLVAKVWAAQPRDSTTAVWKVRHWLTRHPPDVYGDHPVNPPDPERLNLLLSQPETVAVLPQTFWDQIPEYQAGRRQQEAMATSPASVRRRPSRHRS